MKTMAFRLNIARRTLSQVMVQDNLGDEPAPSAVATTDVVTPNIVVLGPDSAEVSDESFPHGRAGPIRAAGERGFGSSAMVPEDWEAARLSVMDNWARRVRFNKKLRAERLARVRAERS